MILPILSIIGVIIILTGFIFIDCVMFDRWINRKRNKDIDREIKYFRGEK